MKSRATMLSLLLFSGQIIGGERLQGADLKEFWTERTIIGEHSRLGSIKTFHAGDGSVHSKSSSGKERKGTWWLDRKRSKKCIRWDSDDKKRCHYTRSNGDGTYSLIHGKKGNVILRISETLDGNQL